MKRSVRVKLSVTALCLSLITMGQVGSGLSQEGSVQELWAAPYGRADSDFESFLQQRMRELEEEFNFKVEALAATAEIAVPLKQPEIENLEQLAEGAFVGALYLGTGSQALQVPSGAYAVQVRFDDAADSWMASLLNRDGELAAEVVAQVIEVDDPGKAPLAFFSGGNRYFEVNGILVCL